eukprot:5540893-Prorocentrum_lima.AAC.1
MGCCLGQPSGIVMAEELLEESGCASAVELQRLLTKEGAQSLAKRVKLLASSRHQEAHPDISLRKEIQQWMGCLLYTSDAADDM